MTLGQEPYVFYIGDESRIVVEDSKKKDKSFFKEIYDKFFTILDQELKFIYRDGEQTSRSHDQLFNNIFAFVGDRGAGKTSCMMSVAKMLENNFNYPILTEKKEKKFFVLDSTDPSFFDEKTNIIDVVLGRMFMKFKAKCDSSEFDVVHKRRERDDLLEKFQEVKNTLTYMNSCSSLSEESNIDELMSLSAAATLKDDIQSLIDSYLNFFDSDILVIPVDDIDLHTMYAYTMAEQVRKYLIQENTVVLMALKIEQMETVIVRHYTMHYKELLDREVMRDSDISDMANKYIVKLIPQSHRLTLKRVEDLLDEPFALKDDSGVTVRNRNEQLKQLVVSMIFEKTRYLFYNSPKKACSIIPRNLREIRHLINLLYRMETYSEGKAGIYNKKLFKDYFLKVWINNVQIVDQPKIQALFANSDAKSLNKCAVDELANKFLKTKPATRRIGRDYNRFYDDSEDSRYSLEIQNIIRSGNVPSNISVGDVFSIIRICLEIAASEFDKAFIFAIETLYSIRLYEYYNEKTDKFPNVEEDKIPIGYSSKLDKFDKYDVLAAGSFINEMDDVVQRHFSSKIACERTDYRVVDLEKIRKVFAESIDRKKNTVVDYEKFKVVELFALMLTRPYDFSDADSLYRTKRESRIFEKYDKDSNYVWMSVYALFANLTNIKNCYDKVDADLYNLATAKNASSLYLAINEVCEKEKQGNKNAFLSCVSIRNSEVLEKLTDCVLETYNNFDSPIDTFSAIIKSFSEFQMLTHDAKDDEKNSYYGINFNFIKEISTLIEKNKATVCDVYDSACTTTQKNIKRIAKEIQAGFSSLFESRDGSLSYSTEVRKNIIASIQKINGLKNKKMLEKAIIEMFDIPIRTRAAAEAIIEHIEEWLNEQPVLA